MRERADKPRRWPAFASAFVCAVVLSTAVLAQSDADRAPDRELTLPPRLESSNPGTRSRIDESAAAVSEDDIEEVIVVREQPWRLPDLGSEWRANEADRGDSGDRIEVKLLPLFDPETLPPERNLFLVNSEMRRVGYIEIFRLRFGRR